MASCAPVTLIIPAYNAAADLAAALEALQESEFQDFEVILCDDGSTDQSVEIAARSPLRPRIVSGQRGGPAAARNRGIRAASGRILIFLDADVTARPDTVGRLVGALEEDPSLDAVFGSYDDSPHHQQFLSQYRNLQHCYYHQTGNRRATTFWAGCGAIRRNAIEEAGGFDESPRWHFIEDIELGYRLVAAGRRIALDPSIQVRHRKRWTLASVLRTDILYRGIPWTDLILRDQRAPSDLNTGPGQRASVAAVGAFGIALLVQAWEAAALCLLTALFLNRGIFRFFAAKRGWWFAIRTIPLFVLYLGYSGAAFGAGVARHFTLRWASRRATPR